MFETGRTSSCSPLTLNKRRLCVPWPRPPTRPARFVSPLYWDQYVKRSRLLHAAPDTLGLLPDWWEAMIGECVERRSALIIVWGDPHRALLDDVPSERVARDHMPLTPSLFQAVSGGQIAWTFIPGPCPWLAAAMLGAPDVDRLWELLTPMLRLDAVDPELAWHEHVARLHERAAITLTGSTALSIVPAPAGETIAHPGACHDTTVRLYVANANEALASTGQHPWTAALAEMRPERERKPVPKISPRSAGGPERWSLMPIPMMG